MKSFKSALIDILLIALTIGFVLFGLALYADSRP